MKRSLLVLPCVLLTCSAFATTRYVSTTGGDISPYDTWSKAGANIQNVINASANGEVIMITNGVYKLAASLNPSFPVRG